MTTVLAVTSNPQTFNGGTWNAAATALNSGVTRFTFTPTAASTTYTGGNFHALFGQAHGAVWLNDANFEKYTTPGDALVYSKAITWTAGLTITITDDSRAKSLTIAGASTGNGTFSYSQAGPYFDATQLMESGRFTAGLFQFVGTISSIDDTAPNESWLPILPTLPTPSLARAAAGALAMSMLTAPLVVDVPPAPALSWQPSYPAHQLRPARAAPNVGGCFAPETVITAPVAPALAWSPTFADRAPGPRRPVNQGGAFAPEATIVNALAPPLSWGPVFPDFAPRSRGVVNAGGMAAPEATIPNPPTPGMSWAPTFPDQILVPRRGQGPTLFAPPFSGGTRLTAGVAAIRQNILSQLAFSTPLTTFGTDLTFTVNAGTDTLTTGTHGMVVCAGPLFLTTTGTLPAGSDAVTPYYAIVPSSTTIKLALTPALAKAGTAVDLIDAGTGTHTLVRAVNVAPLYSTLLAIFARGTQSSSPNQATDSAGNTYSYVTGFPRPYDNFNTSSFSVSTAFNAKGGNAHTWSASIGNIGGQQDEVVIAGLELPGAAILQSSSIVERVDGGAATITSGTVTTTARALLVAIIAGNGNVNQGHVFTFLDGFTKVIRACAEGDVDVAGYIQIEVAVRYVDIKGTYSFRAQGTASEGGQMALLAFQSQSSDLQPLDWLFPLPPDPVRLKRVLQGGETAPPFVTTASVPPLPSWSPTLAELARARRTPASSSAEPVSTDRPVPWLPTFPDQIARPVRQQPSGSTAPPEQDQRLIGWLTTPPELVRARRAPTGGESAPVFTPPSAVVPDPSSWLPLPQGRPLLRRSPAPPGAEVAPVLAIPQPAAPPLSWIPSFPDRAPRARGVVIVGGACAPEATLPNPPAPALSWSPVFPVWQLRRARGVVLIGGEAAPFSGAINFAPPLVQLSPIVTATAHDLLVVSASAPDLLIVRVDNMQTPAPLNLTLYHGETRVIPLELVDPDTGLPANLTSGKWLVTSIEYQIKAAIEGPDPPLLGKAIGAGITVAVGAVLPQIKIFIDPADTPSIAIGRYVHDCVATFASGARLLLIKPRGMQIRGVVNQL